MFLTGSGALLEVLTGSDQVASGRVSNGNFKGLVMFSGWLVSVV